jgi:hypothetical protein
MTTPKVSKTTFPTDQPSQQEWFEQFGVASGYIKPTPYYGGNVFNTKVFLGQRSPGGNLFGKIFNILNPLSWAN